MKLPPVPQLREGLLGLLQLFSLGLVNGSLAVSAFVMNVPLAVLPRGVRIHTS